MSGVKRTKHIDIFGNKHVCVKASDYDKLAGEHAELISGMKENMAEVIEDLHAELWRAKEERDKLAAELAELKAVMAESLDNYRSMLHASEAQVEELKLQNELIVLGWEKLKAKMEGMVLVPVELIEHVKHARKLLGGNGAPEWQREKLRQKLTDLLANTLLTAPQRPAIVAALQAECKGLEDEVNKLERNLAAAPS